MRPWRRLAGEILFEHPLLALERQRVAAGPSGELDDDERDVLVLHAPDWVNVVPLLPDGRVVMVRQWRYGVAAATLEIPGGVVDPGESALDAAARELREETGYAAGTLRPLGDVSPNPAVFANRCHTFLATDLRRVGTVFDAGEEIAVELVPLAEVPLRVRAGEVDHALVLAAFYLLAHAPLSGSGVEEATRATR